MTEQSGMPVAAEEEAVVGSALLTFWKNLALGQIDMTNALRREVGELRAGRADAAPAVAAPMEGLVAPLAWECRRDESYGPDYKLCIARTGLGVFHYGIDALGQAHHVSPEDARDHASEEEARAAAERAYHEIAVDRARTLGLYPSLVKQLGEAVERARLAEAEAERHGREAARLNELRIAVASEWAKDAAARGAEVRKLRGEIAALQKLVEQRAQAPATKREPKVEGVVPTFFGDMVHMTGFDPGHDLILVSTLSRFGGLRPRETLLPHQLYTKNMAGLEVDGDVVVCSIPAAKNLLNVSQALRGEMP